MKNNQIVAKNDNKLARRLTFNDMFFTGVAYMIGVGIFALMPYIIKYGQKNSVLAFIIGGILCTMTGLSFARLNYQYPVNDAEYSWIREILKKKDEKEPSKGVNAFATLTIWVVGLLGVFSMAFISIGLVDYIQTYNLGIPKRLIIIFSLAIPTIINMVGVKSVANFAKVVIYVIISVMVVLIGASGFKGDKKFMKQNSLVPNISNSFNLVRASFLTVQTLTGFQSVVQLSEEAKKKDTIPKSITASVVFTTILYALLVFSVISIIGLSAASKTVYPVSLAYNKIFGTKGRDVVSILCIITMYSALIILILGVSRLFHKLAEKKIAPNYLSKLVSIDELFKKKKKENFENDEKETVQSNNVLDKLGGEAVQGISGYNNKAVKKSKFDKMPIPALLTLFVIAFFLTFIKGGLLEVIANFTNTMLAFIFTVVNFLVIVNYFKFKKVEIKTESKMINTLFKMFPWYAIIGVIVSLVFLIMSPKFYDIL